MRIWHRWLGIIFALFLIVVSVSGIAIHVEKWINTGSLVSHHDTPGLAGMGPPPASAGPMHEPGTQPDARLYNLLVDIHSGVFAGTIGAILSILTGFALLFFAVSGIWMYFKMWENRKFAGRKSFFWGR